MCGAKVPEASVTTKTSYPCSINVRAGKATQISVRTPLFGMLDLLSMCARNRKQDRDLPDDNLLLARLLNFVRKVFVVHCVDLTWASDQWRIREDVGDFLDNWAIWSSFKRRRKNRRGLVVFCHLS